MRVPTLSEPNSTFPTYQVPQVSAMRGRAPPVQVARAAWVARADPPSNPHVPSDVLSVISGSGCPMDNSNLRMQSVTDNCLLNSVTEPKIQRNDPDKVAHNNSDKLACKFGALILGQDIPNQKSDALELGNNDLNELNLTNLNTSTTNTQYLDNDCSLQRLQLINNQRTVNIERQGYSLPLRLRGGGESSISTGTTGWGTPPSQQASNNNSNTTSGWGTANPANQSNTGTQQWNNNANRPPTSVPGPNSQDANKQNSNLPPSNQQPPTTQPNNTGWGPGPKPPTGPAPSTNNNANATNQPSNGQAGPPSTSTKQQLEQLNNMREAIFSSDGWGGQHVNQDTSWDIPSSPEPSLKMDGSGAPPWKPTVNNGTELWEANLRNGGQPPPQPQQKTPWGHTPSSNIGGTWGEDDDVADSSNVWTGVPSTQQQWGGGAAGNGGGPMWGSGGPKKESEWGGNAGGAGWGDPRTNDPRTTGIDPRDIRGGGPDPRDIRGGAGSDAVRMLDPRVQMRLEGSDMRGDPRGITGRLNGAGTEGFWAQAGPQTGAHHMHHQNKLPVIPGNGGAGWEEPSPPSQRRNMPNYDDGTYVWGNPQQGQRLSGSHWKDIPTGANMGRGNSAGPPGMAPSRINKPDASLWGNQGRNGSWDEPTPGWDESGSWPKQKPMAGQLWETEMDWGHKQGQKQPIPKEMVWNAKQLRHLADLGYKKEEIETALRREMNVDDVDTFAATARNNFDWRSGRNEDHFDHQQFPGQRFPTGPAAQIGFPPGGSTTNILNSINGTSAPGNNSLMNNLNSAVVQKMLSQTGSLPGFGGTNSTGGRSLQTSQPTSAHLKMLVQQIQMAVQAGYLNHQILNQPLAPQTLVLLNQLLQQIKNLQQITSQQSMAQAHGMANKQSNTLLHCSVLITKCKQQISNLQNQIAASQATYVKQQQHLSSASGGPADIFKANPPHDSINAVQTNFADFTIKDPPQMTQQQSRLNQWKLPALDKEEEVDFSRAPGSVTKPLAPSHSSPNLNPLGFTQPDGPWSSGRSGGDTGWPDSGTVDSAPDGKDPQWPAPSQASYTDLVPEFEPGKPWRGTQMKSAEDDPTMTPGSVVRSPLSGATIKDTELFNTNTSNTTANDAIQPLSLSSSTWSFNPPASTSSVFTSPQSKLPNTKGALGDLNPSTTVTSELWGAPKSRGPPPGLPSKGTSAVNGWGSSNLGAGSWGQQRNWSTSPWLLLRNLTAQIDGSTLRTLCMQHGPLQSFHLYLHQGFALAKYSTREEATKAQTALNNCVLGNTTILAENPSDWDASHILQQLANQQGGSSGSWRGSGKQPGTSGDTWSTGWPNASSASLWGTSALDSAEQARATPSSLNSYLPGDLLGGESM